MHSSAVSLLSHLIAEDEADIVVVNLRVHEEGSLEVHPSKPMEADRQPRVAEHSIKGLKKILGRLLKFEDDLLFIPVQCSWLGKYKNKLKIKGRLLRFEDDLLFLPVHGLDNTRINDKFKVVL